MAYTGVEVSHQFSHAWRKAKLVGVARPLQQVFVRRGRLVRSFKRWPDPQFGEVASRKTGLTWFPDWVPDGDGEWTELPAVTSVEINQDFANNGVASLTLEAAANAFTESTGPGGIYHFFDRGYYAPLRGNRPPKRPPPGVVKNDWFMKLPNAQILVKQGYGDQLYKTFTGLVDTIDTGVKPGVLTITARDFGSILVDEHIFGWAKDRLLSNPVIFVPREKAEKQERIRGGASSSSHRPGHHAAGIVQAGSRVSWQSSARHDADDFEWFDLHLPHGRYHSLYLNPRFANQEIWIGFYCYPRGEQNLLYCRWAAHGSLGSAPIDVADGLLEPDGSIPSPNDGHEVGTGWLDVGASSMPDGTPAIRHFDKLPKKGAHIHLGGEVLAGAGSRIRIGISKLHKTDDVFPRGDANAGDPIYRAGLTHAYAIRSNWTKDAKHEHWVLIDDISEIVLYALRLAGFKDWEVESCGVNITGQVPIGESNTFMDLINRVRDQSGYAFFIAEPNQNDDLSIGTPIFRQNGIFHPRGAIPRLSDNDLLTDIKTSWSNQHERYIIRARGQMLSKRKGGVTLGSDKIRRAQFVYRPPWHDRMAGVIKHITHDDAKFKTVTDCQFATYLIALQIALANWTAQCQIPGTPAIGLDTQVGLVSPDSGLDSKLYVSNRRSTFTLGEESSWIMELGGALPDTPDVLGVVEDYLLAIDELDRSD